MAAPEFTGMLSIALYCSPSATVLRMCFVSTSRFLTATGCLFLSLPVYVGEPNSRKKRGFVAPYPSVSASVLEQGGLKIR
jgi:hypothetical protein